MTINDISCKLTVQFANATCRQRDGVAEVTFNDVVTDDRLPLAIRRAGDEMELPNYIIQALCQQAECMLLADLLAKRMLP